jgi:hypothetical protein
MKNLDYIIQKALKTIVSEQAPTPTSRETDNAPSDAVDSPFTPAEKKFLGKFDAYGTTHIGIIYSTSDIGIREFITRSGVDLNITAGILSSLLKQKIVKIVPYTGFGRNTDYTIELQLSLDDVKGLGAEDKEKAEAGSSASGAAEGGTETPSAPEPTPAPEVSWVIPYGTLIKEATEIAKKLIKQPLTEATKDVDAKVKGKVWVKPSRMLKDMPAAFIKHLDQLITYLSKRSYSKSQQERLIADILDNLAINLKLNSKQIRKSYDLHKNQNKLQTVLDLSEGVEFINEFALLRENRVQQEYLEKLGFKSLINNAFNFWNIMPTTVDQGVVFDDLVESEFYKIFATHVQSRKSAIVIDAVGYILSKSLKRGPATEYLRFCGDWYNAWGNLRVPIPGLSDETYSIPGILNDRNITLYVLKDSSEVKNVEKLSNRLNLNGIGYINLLKSNNTFTPTYSEADRDKMVNTLLAPYRSKSLVDPKSGKETVKVTAADRLSNEQKVARGKYAKAQVIKMINAFYPKAKNKWTGDKDAKSWVDSNGVGIYILPASSTMDTKYIIYPDGTLKSYVDSNLKSTEKLTNKIVKYNGQWFIKGRWVNNK